MGLYPAQTGRARAARGLLRCLLRGSLPFGGKNLALAIQPNDEFVRFLAGLAGSPADGVPSFGVLAGNPASEGQRFLVLVFDAEQRPVAVVKAGLSPQAKELIEKERRFLEQAPAHTAGLPKLRGQLDCARLRAFALGFFDGDSPRPAQGSGFEALLSSWVDTKFKMPLSDAPTWRMLERNSPAHELFGFLARRLRQHPVQVAIHHGDFAPWNIKVSRRGDWTVLDWERGEMIGIPGWDWFHYVLQPAILVERQSTVRLVQRVETLLESASFKSYAHKAGLAGAERELVLAYLSHAAEVIRPSEGLAQTRKLLEALWGQWKRG